MRDINVTEAKNRLTELVKEVEQTTSSYGILRNGHKAAVLLSAEEYEGILESLEVLGSRSLVKQMIQSAKEFARGQKIPFSKIRREV